jgi:hypothetical protein
MIRDFVMRVIRLILCPLAVSACLLISSAYAIEATDVPGAAKSVGFTRHTFSTRRFSTENVDLGRSYASGSQWYLFNFFNMVAPPQAALLGPDGSIVLSDTRPDNLNGNIATGGLNRSTGFVGTGFGCGAYMEAEFRFDDSRIKEPSGKIDWPSFWTMSVEHLAGTQEENWPGQQPGYWHFAEFDIFEKVWPGAKYAATIHDWFGVQLKTCSNNAQFCSIDSYDSNSIPVPAGTDFGRFHRAAMLWVPATETTRGYAKFYFDRAEVGAAQSWAQFKEQPPPPVNSKYPWVSDPPSWSYGIVDKQHLVLLLGSGSIPMTVRSVDVWQGDKACNVSK